MTEEQKLLEQAESKEQEDNLVLAERMIDQLLPAFHESLEHLSRKETVKLLKLMVRFPFIEKEELKKKFDLNHKQKIAFMYGERLIYANMVKRARAELDRTFGEVEKEMENTENGTSDKTSGSNGSNEENRSSQV